MPARRADTSLGAIALAVLCVAQFVDVMSVNTAVVALPDIRSDLRLGAGAGQWVISVYALLFGSLLLLGGRLADRAGGRRMVAAGMAAFAAASLACGVAPTGAVLIAARAGTGVAAALTVPAALALLVATTHAEQRRRALAWWTAAGAGGGIAGLTAGGVLTGLAGWRAAFVVPAALAAACLPLVRALPSPPRPPARPLDLAGALAAAAALGLLLVGLTEAGDGRFGPATWAPLAGAVAVAIAFVRIEARAPHPLLPRGLAADRGLVAGTLASAVNTAATTPLGVLGAIYLQDVLGWSPAANGLSFVPTSAMVVAGSALGAALVGRLGAPRTFAAALAGLIAMPLVSTAIAADGGAAILIAARAVDGLALGCAAVTATALGTGGARAGDQGFAAGLVNTATQLGTALSVALLVPLSAAVGGVHGLRVAFVGIALVAAAGGAATLALLRTGSHVMSGSGRPIRLNQ